MKVRVSVVGLISLTVALAGMRPSRALTVEHRDSRVAAEVEELLSQIVEIRHRIHQNPELGNREFETAALVAAHLNALGIEVRSGVAHTGVIGTLRGTHSGPVVAVRADMDALPVTEETSFAFKSTRRSTYLGQEVGVAHACGHDVHTAVALGTASVLASMREELRGTVKFLFQPAEEGAPPGERGGAELMLEEGAFDEPSPSVIFGLHAFPDFQVGEVGFTPGPTMASVDQFSIEIRGRQAHGAYPHLSIDPIVMAAQAVTALQTIRSRNLDPREASVITVGIIRGGERFNIIPDEVHLEGTVRTFSVEVQDQVEKRMREILEGITRAGGGQFDLDYQRVTPPTINDPELAQRVRPILERVLGAEQVVDADPVMAGEDFAFFAEKVPGFYLRLGVVKPGTHSGGLHTPDFTADDSALAVGIRAMATLVLDYLAAE